MQEMRSNRIWISATLTCTQHAEADRREVDPPIQVKTATWSPGGKLDWWVKDRQEWWGWVRGAKTAVKVNQSC
jgi:hypothetical protein